MRRTLVILLVMCITLSSLHESDAFQPSYLKRRRSSHKVHVRSASNLQFDDDFTGTLETELEELEDHENNNSEGN